MKKLVLIIYVLISFCSSFIFAEDSVHTVSFRAVVPDDYGVAFPGDAVRLDRLMFQLPNGDLISYETGLDEFVLEVGEDTISLDIIYYGNLEEDYQVVIDADSVGWLIGQDGDNRVPVSISFDDYMGIDGIESEINIDGSITITVPAVGARHAHKVGSLILTWEYPLSLIPGNYTMELDLSIRSEA